MRKILLMLLAVFWLAATVWAETMPTATTIENDTTATTLDSIQDWSPPISLYSYTIGETTPAITHWAGDSSLVRVTEEKATIETPAGMAAGKRSEQNKGTPHMLLTSNYNTNTAATNYTAESYTDDNNRSPGKFC